MKRWKMFCFCCLGIASLGGLGAQMAEWAWATRVGNADYDNGSDIVLDGAGNQYVTGYFQGTASFGATSLTSSGGQDVFIAKQSGAGNWLWAVKAGGTGDDIGYAITLDPGGNVLVTGKFNGTATIGQAIVISNGDNDMFVAKYSNSGSWIWTRQAGGTAPDIGNDLATDANGNVYLTGSFGSTASFGSTSLTTVGGSDIFAAKLNSAGTWQWAVRAGGTSTDRGKGIAVDGEGNLLLTGDIYGDVAFGTISLEARIYDAFAAKLSSAGSWVWAKKAGSAGLDWGFGIAVDTQGNGYLTGFFEGTAAFGTIALISAGSEDIFVAKISSAGVWQWARKAGGTSNDEGFDIAVDPSGRVSVTGYFQGTAAFGIHSLTSAGDEDIFVARLSSTGVWQWALRAGGLDRDWGMGIAVDNLSYARVTGEFRRTADFGAHTLEGAGVTYSPDIYVAKVTARPLAPVNLSASHVNYYDLLLDWDDVTQDTFNNTISNVHYLVYVIHDHPGANPSVVLGEGGSIPDSEHFIDGGMGFDIEFFRVSAVLGN